MTSSGEKLDKGVFKILGTLWEAIQVLLRLASSPDELFRAIQRIISDSHHRRQVWLVMSGQKVITEITKDEWAEREASVLNQLGIAVVNDELRIRQMANDGHFGVSHYFVSAELSRSQLLQIAEEVGIKLFPNPNRDGEDFLTEQGVLECDLSKIMTPTDAQHRPFNLNYEEQESWAKEQGGDGLTSIEEFLYLLIRAFLQFGKIPYMGGWTQCRNRRDSGGSLEVNFNVGFGLGVCSGGLDDRDWSCGALPRKFLKI